MRLIKKLSIGIIRHFKRRKLFEELMPFINWRNDDIFATSQDFLKHAELENCTRITNVHAYMVSLSSVVQCDSQYL